MGDLFGDFNNTPEAQIARDGNQAVAPPEGKVKTDVDGCFADAINKRDNLPVFKVDHNSFFQNMSFGRNRIRFKSGTDVQKYMQGSRYKQSFWVQHETDGYMRKVK